METADAIVTVESPYKGKRLTVIQQVAISAYWFGSNVLWGAYLINIVPEVVKSITSHNLAAFAKPGEGSSWFSWQLFQLLTEKGKALGVVGSAVAVVSLLVPLLAGALSDRCASRWGRRRPYIAWGSLVSVTGIGLMFVAGETRAFWWFVASYCVVALGNNVATGAFCGVIPDLVPGDQRGVASGYMALMSQVGTLVGALLSGFLSIGMAYALVIVCIAFCTMVTLVGIKENPLPSKPPPLRVVPYLKSLWIDPRRYPDFAWVWITRFLVMLAFYSVQPFINYFLHDVLQIADAKKMAAILLGLILVGATLSAMYGGILSERTGRKKIVYGASVVMALMCIALIFCRTYQAALVVGVLFGIGYGAYVSVDWALGTDVLPSGREAGKDMGVWHISMTLPQSVTPILAGYLILPAFGSTTYKDLDGEMVQQYTHSGYAAVFILAAVFFLLGAYFLKNVRNAR